MRHFASFERSRAKIGPREKIKNKKKSQDPYISPSPGAATARQIRAKLGSFGGPLEVITHTHFEIDRVRAVRVVRGDRTAFQHYTD